MSGPLHEYQIRITGPAGQSQLQSKPKKFDLEQIQTEASMVAEIYGRQVVIYSRPTVGGSWQIIERIEAPTVEDEIE
jgi:hypothetical protein